MLPKSVNNSCSFEGCNSFSFASCNSWLNAFTKDGSHAFVSNKDDSGQCSHLNLYIFCFRTIISYTVKIKTLKKV